MITKKILKLVQKKYGSLYFILIYPDESGRITNDYQHPHKTVPVYEFSSLKELVEHLKGIKND